MQSNPWALRTCYFSSPFKRMKCALYACARSQGERVPIIIHSTSDSGFDNKAGWLYKGLHAVANLSLRVLHFSWNALLSVHRRDVQYTHTHTGLLTYMGLVCKPSIEGTINRILSLITLAIDPLSSSSCQCLSVRGQCLCSPPVAAYIPR